VLGSRGATDFVDAVRAYVAAYRVPCLLPGRTATLKQEFDFKLAGGRNVLASRPRDRDTLRTSRMIACSTHPPAQPYPWAAERNGEWGTVAIKLRFDGLGAEPTATALEAPDSQALREAALDQARATRLPCADGAPVEWMMYYYFRFEGYRPASFKDMQLRDLIRSSKNVDSAEVYFDTRTMGCPFDLRFGHRQPHDLNSVTEIGTSDPERYFFLDWLARLQLDLPPRVHNALIGRGANVHVPCTIIHLGTKTGGGAAQ
jgi:hypothetical protein